MNRQRNYVAELNKIYDDWTRANFKRSQEIIYFFQGNLSTDYKAFQRNLKDQQRAVNNLLSSVCQIAGQLPNPDIQLLKKEIIDQSKECENALLKMISLVDGFTAKSLVEIKSYSSPKKRKGE